MIKYAIDESALEIILTHMHLISYFILNKNQYVL